MQQQICIEGLKVEYRRPGQTQRLLAVDDFHLSVGRSEFITIVGPSGCGKSTTLMAVAGLLHPAGGRVTINGQAVKAPGKDRAMVFQEFGLLPWRTVSGNVAMGFEFHGDRPRGSAAKEIVERYVHLVGLDGFQEHYPHQLSGGMRQRVGLARALAANPDILLMDEPFGALDAQTREIMGADLGRIWDQTKKTVLFVTHSIDESIYLADRVVVVTARPGRVKALIDVKLPRPRSRVIKSTPEFGEYREQIWGLLEEEVKAAWGARKK